MHKGLYHLIGPYPTPAIEEEIRNLLYAKFPDILGEDYEEDLEQHEGKEDRQEAQEGLQEAQEYVNRVYR